MKNQNNACEEDVIFMCVQAVKLNCCIADHPKETTQNQY